MKGTVVLSANAQMKKLRHPVRLYSPFRKALRVCAIWTTYAVP